MLRNRGSCKGPCLGHCKSSKLLFFLTHTQKQIISDFLRSKFFKLSSTRPYIRKRGVLLLYKMFLKYPECLKSTFPRLKEKLEDPDAGECVFFFIWPKSDA